MSLSAKLVAGVEAAFSAVGNLVVTATVRRVRAGAYDAATGSPSQIVEEWRDVPAIVSEYHSREVDGERVKATDRRVYLKARATLPEPQPGDSIVIGAQVFTILPPVSTTKAGATALLHECQGRI